MQVILKLFFEKNNSDKSHGFIRDFCHIGHCDSIQWHCHSMRRRKAAYRRHRLTFKTVATALSLFLRWTSALRFFPYTNRGIGMTRLHLRLG